MFPVPVQRIICQHRFPPLFSLSLSQQFQKSSHGIQRDGVEWNQCEEKMSNWRSSSVSSSVSSLLPLPPPPRVPSRTVAIVALVSLKDTLQSKCCFGDGFCSAGAPKMGGGGRGCLPGFPVAHDTALPFCRKEKKTILEKKIKNLRLSL